MSGCMWAPYFRVSYQDHDTPRCMLMAQILGCPARKAGRRIACKAARRFQILARDGGAVISGVPYQDHDAPRCMLMAQIPGCPARKAARRIACKTGRRFQSLARDGLLPKACGICKFGVLLARKAARRIACKTFENIPKFGTQSIASECLRNAEVRRATGSFRRNQELSWPSACLFFCRRWRMDPCSGLIHVIPGVAITVAILA